MLTIGQLLEQNGWTHDQLAEELTRRGHTVKGPSIRKGYALSNAVPSRWREVLELEPTVAAAPIGPDDFDRAPPWADDSAPDETEPGRQAETPPAQPAGARTAPTSLQVRSFARQRIAKTYAFVGSGLAMGLDPDGATHDRGVGGGIAAVWGDQSDPLAQAWVNAADESPFARRFVELMSAGGAMGEVVTAHVVLVASTLYVAGQLPEVGPLFSKYRRYRSVIDSSGQARPGAAGAGGAGADGAGVAAANGSVAPHPG